MSTITSPQRPLQPEAPLLDIQDLSIAFRGSQGRVSAVSHLNLSLQHGETLALMGESGCGKSATALALLRLARLGYTGDYSLDVSNDDYAQLPAEHVAAQARQSAGWLNDDVLHRAAPLPHWTRAQANTR